MLSKSNFLTFSVWLLIAMSLQADASAMDNNCFETSDVIQGSLLHPNLYHYSDYSGEITSPDLDSGYKLSETTRDLKFIRLGNYDDDDVLEKVHPDQWLRFCLSNTSNHVHDLVLAVDPPTLSEVDFYPQKLGLRSFKTGLTKLENSRDIPNGRFRFAVSLEPKEQQTFYLRINTSEYPFYRRAKLAENPSFKAKIWDRNSFDRDNNASEITFGIVVGVFIALAIYNLLLFILARQYTSFLYIVLISSVFIAFLSLNGRFVQFTPPEYPGLSNLVIVLFYPLSFLMAAIFLKEFVKLKSYPRLNWIGNAFLLFCAAALIGSYGYNKLIFAQLCDVIGIFIFFYFGALVPIYVFLKDRLLGAKYVLITMTPLFFALIDRSIFGFGLTDQYYMPYKIVTAAMAGMIGLSCYMGLIAYREKQAAQRSAMEQLNISNTLKSNYNNQLEQELKQKTADILLMNEDLEHKADKLLQLDESKSRFFANISHEFRTPITLIEGPLTMLLQQDDFREKHIVEGVLRNSNSLKSLIDQILLLSELDEKSLDLNALQVNVVQLVNEFVSQFSSLAEHKGIELSCEADSEVINVYIDIEKLQIVINNLVNNAIKFTEDGGQITVGVSSTVPSSEANNDFDRDEYVKIIVSDTGSGIHDKELPFVFDRYFQSDSSELSKSGVGTGIGLALVKELVELHAGEVSVESTFKQERSQIPSGTSFLVRIPLGRAHLSDNEIVELSESVKLPLPASLAYQDSVPETLESDERHLATVLVVDDNEDMRRYIKRLLEDDYHVLTAQDGLLAEGVVNKQLPDLIVTDLMMPNRDGLEFVKTIKLKPKLANIPVIMLTARAGLHDRIQGLMAAIDDYMVKPFDGRELKIRIHNLLNKQAQFSAFYREIAPVTDEPNESVRPEGFLAKAKSVVNQRLVEPEFGVQELANDLHVSEATLRRRLAELAQFTPAAFIRHCRLEKARQLIADGKARSVAELALSVGFNTPSYFATLYKNTFNTKVDLSSSSISAE